MYVWICRNSFKTFLNQNQDSKDSMLLSGELLYLGNTIYILVCFVYHSLTFNVNQYSFFYYYGNVVFFILLFNLPVHWSFPINIVEIFFNVRFVFFVLFKCFHMTIFNLISYFFFYNSFCKFDNKILFFFICYYLLSFAYVPEHTFVYYFGFFLIYFNTLYIPVKREREKEWDKYKLFKRFNKNRLKINRKYAYKVKKPTYFWIMICFFLIL